MPSGALVYPTIKVEGSELTDAAAGRVVDVEVDATVHLPGMALIVFGDDPTGGALKASNIKIGSEIVVSSPGRSSTSPSDLIKAEVVSIEADFGSHGVRTAVRAYEKSHRLHLARHSQTFANMTDSDIAQKVAQGAGLTVGTIDSTSATHEYLAQIDQTDWEFLVARAKEIGYEVGVSDGKFYFRKPIKSSTAPASDSAPTAPPPALELRWGFNLVALDIRASGAGQAGTVTVRAWDPVNKQAVTANGTPASTEATNSQHSPSSMASAFGSATTVVADRPVGIQAAADALAAGLAAAVGSNFVECDGAAHGDPALSAGVAVRLSGVGDSFSGQYTLTRVRHTFDEDGYITHFEISGRRDRTLAGMTSSSGGSATNSSNGLVIGQVTQNGDTNHPGMVKVKFPWLDDKYESDWVRVAMPGAGPDSGLHWYPEKDDEVLVGFEFGDSRRPYVLSSLWNGQDKPKDGDGLFDNGKVKRRGFVSRKGHKFIFFDDGSKSGIGMLSSDGKLKLSLNESNGEIKIHASGKITLITEGGGDVTINSNGKLDVQTQGDTSIQAQGQVKVNGTGGVNVQSSGQVQISGSMIQIG